VAAASAAAADACSAIDTSMMNLCEFL